MIDKQFYNWFSDTNPEQDETEKKEVRMVTATCVECDEEIEINDRPRRGLRVICPNCGAQLEVVSTNPIELDLPFDEDEEWEEDDFDFEDDDDLDFDDFEDDEWEDDDFDDDDDDDNDDDWS